MEEIWKEIPNSKYLISSEGRIRTLYRKGTPLIWFGKNNSGYYNIVLIIDGKKKHNYVHRLVASAFLENPYNLSEVNHLDGNKTNNLVSNLEWINRKGNKKHAFNTGITRGLAKLTYEDAQNIRKEDPDIKDEDLAKKYGVGFLTIYRVRKNISW
jgi:hypothetical protein